MSQKEMSQNGRPPPTPPTPPTPSNALPVSTNDSLAPFDIEDLYSNFSRPGQSFGTLGSIGTLRGPESDVCYPLPSSPPQNVPKIGQNGLFASLSPLPTPPIPQTIQMDSDSDSEIDDPNDVLGDGRPKTHIPSGCQSSSSRTGGGSPTLDMEVPDAPHGFGVTEVDTYASITYQALEAPQMSMTVEEVTAMGADLTNELEFGEALKALEAQDSAMKAESDQLIMTVNHLKEDFISTQKEKIDELEKMVKLLNDQLSHMVSEMDDSNVAMEEMMRENEELRDINNTLKSDLLTSQITVSTTTAALEVERMRSEGILSRVEELELELIEEKTNTSNARLGIIDLRQELQQAYSDPVVVSVTDEDIERLTSRIVEEGREYRSNVDEVVNTTMTTWLAKNIIGQIEPVNGGEAEVIHRAEQQQGIYPIVDGVATCLVTGLVNRLNELVVSVDQYTGAVNSSTHSLNKFSEKMSSQLTAEKSASEALPARTILASINDQTDRFSEKVNTFSDLAHQVTDDAGAISNSVGRCIRAYEDAKMMIAEMVHPSEGQSWSESMDLLELIWNRLTDHISKWSTEAAQFKPSILSYVDTLMTEASHEFTNRCDLVGRHLLDQIARQGKRKGHIDADADESTGGSSDDYLGHILALRPFETDGVPKFITMLLLLSQMMYGRECVDILANVVKVLGEVDEATSENPSILDGIGIDGSGPLNEVRKAIQRFKNIENTLIDLSSIDSNKSGRPNDFIIPDDIIRRFATDHMYSHVSSVVTQDSDLVKTIIGDGNIKRKISKLNASPSSSSVHYSSSD